MMIKKRTDMLTMEKKSSLTLADLAPYGGRLAPLTFGTGSKSGMTGMTDVLTMEKDTIPTSEIPRSTLGMTEKAMTKKAADVLTMEKKSSLTLADLAPYGGRFRIKSGMTGKAMQLIRRDTMAMATDKGRPQGSPLQRTG
jgi:hypothetical protein